MIAINGTRLPSPGSLSVRKVRRVGSTDYNSLGKMVQDGVREKNIVEIIWPRMSASVLSELAALLESAPFFQLSYPDPLEGNREMEGWAAEKQARVWKFEGGMPAWADVKLVVEER